MQQIQSTELASAAAHQQETSDAAGTEFNVPKDVRYALDRMCLPLHESRLGGVTAQEDARCMTLIKSFIDGLPHSAALPPDHGPKVASEFWNELLEKHECLSDIATIYDAQTLADCMYLQNTIIEGAFMEKTQSYGAPTIIDLVTTLPSAARWLEFIRINQSFF